MHLSFSNCQDVSVNAILAGVGFPSADRGSDGQYENKAVSGGSLTGCSGSIIPRYGQGILPARTLSTVGNSYSAPNVDFGVVSLLPDKCTDSITEAILPFAFNVPVPVDTRAIAVTPISNLMAGRFAAQLGSVLRKVR